MNGRQSKESIFFAALELQSSGDREAFLATACGEDAGLRRQVERLLANHNVVGGFLERPVQEVVEENESAASGTEVDVSLSFLSPSQRPDALGRLGHYEVLQILGTGGMGTVFRAFDEKLHRVIAIKVLSPTLAAVAPARKRFVREARSAASVIHDNIIDVHCVEDDGPVPYLVMQLIEGITLQQKIDRTGPLPVVEVLRLGRQIAAGLAAAHRQGIVHRDVKPSNILLENGVERVKITDFGLARSVDAPAMTVTGMIAGTPAYMSPEQANGEVVDHRSDLFSLGSVLYAMATGDAPFRATSMMGVLKRVCENTPRPVRAINPAAPEWLGQLIEALHAKQPADRPSSAAVVAELLELRLAELQQPDRATEVLPAKHLSTPARRLMPRWVVAAIVLAITCAGLTEATGVTNIRGTAVRLIMPDGTLVVEVDDPGVSVTVEGTDLVITGAGAKEIRLRPGEYRVSATKDGKVVQQELVGVSRNGRQVVRISKEPAPMTAAEPGRVPLREDALAWEKSVAALPAAQQVHAVTRRLKELNPGFDGNLDPKMENGRVAVVSLSPKNLTDISPVRGFVKLEVILSHDPEGEAGKVADLTPLRGIPLKRFFSSRNPIKSLEPLRGMRLDALGVSRAHVTDLEPLRGMPLVSLSIDDNPVTDLAPIRGLALTYLRIDDTKVSDLTPLEGMKLETLSLAGTAVTDLSLLRGMPLKWLDLSRMQYLRDYSPIRGLQLEVLMLEGLRTLDLSRFAAIKSLKALYLDDTPLSSLRSIENLRLNTLSIRRTNLQPDDLAEVAGFPLTEIALDYSPAFEPVLRKFPGLTTINHMPADTFWKSVGKP